MPLLRNLWLGILLSFSVIILNGCSDESKQPKQVPETTTSKQATSAESLKYYELYKEVASQAASSLNAEFTFDGDLAQKLLNLLSQSVPEDLPIEQQKQAYWFKVKAINYALKSTSNFAKQLINKLDSSNDITYLSLSLITSTTDYFRAKQEFSNLTPADDLIYQAVGARLMLEVDVQDVYYLYPLNNKYRDQQKSSVDETIAYARECSANQLQDPQLDEFGIATACDLYLSTIYSSTMGFAVDFDKELAHKYEHQALANRNLGALYIKAVSQLYTEEELLDLLGPSLIKRPLGMLIHKALNDNAVPETWEQIVRLIDRDEPYVDNLTKGYVLLAIANLYNNPDIYASSITYAEPSAIWAIIDISIEDAPVTLDSKILQKQVFGRTIKDLLHYAALMNHPWAQLRIAELYNELDPNQIKEEPFWLTKAAINNMWDSDDENLAVHTLVEAYEAAKAMGNQKAMSYYKESLKIACSYYSTDDFACRSLNSLQ